MVILLTVDVEDWFQVENLRSCFPLANWSGCELRVEQNTRRLLDLFGRHNVKATFFVLGWIAEQCPALVREIRSAGHEVASHGYNHQVTYGLSGEELQEDLHRSKSLLEEIIGGPVLGYRAPKFSLSENVCKLLIELGYRYDSSFNSFCSNHIRSNGSNSFAHSLINSFPCSHIDPVPNPRNGAQQHSSTATPQHRITATPLYELPISNLRIGRWVVPVGGGGYFRLWPTALFERGVSRMLDTEGRYVFYMHPWEIDPDQPRTEKVTGLRRLKHYLNLDKTFGRLDHFLTRFRKAYFMTCREYVNNMLTSNKLMS